MPFVKGQSGNPNGRPVIVNSLANILREELEKVGEDGVLNKLAIAQRVIKVARVGEDAVALVAARDIFNRLEGSPKQAVDVTVEEKRPIVFAPELSGSDETE